MIGRTNELYFYKFYILILSWDSAIAVMKHSYLSLDGKQMTTVWDF